MTDRRAGFSRMYDAHYASILGYAMRRTEDPDEAHDVVSETFLVAWRRYDDLPPEDEIRLWLYGVARKVLANQHRSRRRRTRLADELRHHAAMDSPASLTSLDPDDGPAIAAAFANLRAGDRELLLLAAWEGLEPAAIARVLGISAVAARVRLHRARQRFAVHLANAGVLHPQHRERAARPAMARVAAPSTSEES